MSRVIDAFQHHRRLLAVFSGLLLFYALVGFFAVPWLAERYLVNTLEDRLAVDTRIDRIRFNPFTFTTTLEQLQLRGNGDPFLAVDEIYLNMAPSRLFLGRLRLTELSIIAPQFYFTRYTESDNTLSRLADRWMASGNREAPDQAPDDNGFMPLEVGDFTFINGGVQYRDEVPDPVFETTLNPINIRLQNFSTADAEDAGDQALVVLLEQDGRLILDGEFSLSPLVFAGEVSLQNFDLQIPYRYLAADLPLVLDSGRLDIDFAYRFALPENGPRSDAGPHLEISALTVQLADIAARAHDADEPFITGERIVLRDGLYHLPDSTLTIESVVADTLTLGVIRNAAGDVDWVEMIAPLMDPDSDFPVQMNIAQLDVRNTAVTYQDYVPETDASVELLIDLQAQDFNPEQPGAFTTRINLASGGNIELAGELQVLPDLIVDAELAVQEVSVLPLQPYVNELAWVEVIAGSIDLSATLQHDAQEPMALQGDFSLIDLQVYDRNMGEPLLSLAAAAISAVDFSVAERRLAVSEVLLESPYARVLINENGETNVGQVMREAAVDEEPEPQTERMISLGRVQIVDGSSLFTDQNLPVVFEAQLETLNGELGGFSTANEQLMQVSLAGEVDEFGTVDIIGTIDPLDPAEQSAIELTLINLELPAMTPYSIKFLGHEIAEGRADLNLFYDVVDGELAATNRIVLRNITLGEQIDSPDALNLPLGLAIALLEDADGVIDLEIPVSGDIGDPEFNLGPLIREALTSTVNSIVTAPFRFLAGLIDDNDELEISSVRFEPGASALTGPQEERLLQLADALSRRPQLILAIPGPVAPEADSEALQISLVDGRIAERLEVDESHEQYTQRRLNVLERLYEETELRPSLAELRHEFIRPDAETDEDGLPSVIELNAVGFSDELRARLIRAESITDQQLAELAENRQEAVVAVLADNAVASDQLAPQDTVTTESEDGWVYLAFEVSVR